MAKVGEGIAVDGITVDTGFDGDVETAVGSPAPPQAISSPTPIQRSINLTGFSLTLVPSPDLLGWCLLRTVLLSLYYLYGMRGL